MLLILSVPQFMALPPMILVLSMIAIFRRLNQSFGYPLGYLPGFLIYWLGWCLLVPIFLLGGLQAIFGLFTPFAPLAALV
jgi:hypothetical protein